MSFVSLVGGDAGVGLEVHLGLRLDDGLPVVVQDTDSLVEALLEGGVVLEQLLKLADLHALEEHARQLAGRHVGRPGRDCLRLVAVVSGLLHVSQLGLDLGEDEVAEVLLLKDRLGLLLLGQGLLGQGLLLHRVKEVGELHDLCRRLRAERDLAVGDDLAARNGHGHGLRRGLEALLCAPLGPRHAEAAPLVEGRADQADGGLLVDLLAVGGHRACGEEDTARTLLARVDEGAARTLLLVRAVAAVLAGLRRVEALLVQLGLGGPREGRRGPGDGRAGHLCVDGSGAGTYLGGRLRLQFLRASLTVLKMSYAMGAGSP